MQTFLPYKSYTKSAEVLDYRRLGKQRVECKQIHQALTGKSQGWVNHPATKMWAGNLRSFVEYAQAMMFEWEHIRGYDNTLCGAYFKEQEFYDSLFVNFKENQNPSPIWLTDDFCRSHQSNLIRKKPEFYKPIFGDVPDDLPYIWPTS